MKERALRDARARLERARAACVAIDVDHWKYDELETAWWQFLLATNGVFAKLEQGAKGHGPSEAWFGRIKHERRTDELLNYLRHARNSEEHGLDGSSSPAGIRGKSLTKGVKVFHNDDGEIDRIEVPSTLPVSAEFPVSVQLSPPGLRLLPLKDRCGNVYEPPSKHLGQTIDERSPRGVAKLALKFFQRIVAEAEDLPQHT